MISQYFTGVQELVARAIRVLPTPYTTMPLFHSHGSPIHHGISPQSGEAAQCQSQQCYAMAVGLVRRHPSKRHRILSALATVAQARHLASARFLPSLLAGVVLLVLAVSAAPPTSHFAR